MARTKPPTRVLNTQNTRHASDVKPKARSSNSTQLSNFKQEPITPGSSRTKSFPTPSSSESDPGVDSGSRIEGEVWSGSGPDPKEWADLSIYRIYRSFRRSDAGESVFVGDFVYIWGDDLKNSARDQSERTRWIGKICAIRAKSKDRVFMEIAWLYTSAAQLRESKITFPRKYLARNECVLSDLRDVVNVWCVEERASVKRFDELDPWQEEILSEDEYYRSEVVRDKAGRLRVSQLRPNTCTSKKPYKPPPHGATPMVYCPRPGCLKWYHQNHAKKITAASADQLGELASTGLELLSSRSSGTAAKDEGAQSIPPANTQEDIREDEEEEAHWDTISRFASSSITRGIHSIVGNTIPVLEAREALNSNDGNAKYGDDTASEIMRQWFKRHDPEDDEIDDGVRWVCPGCRGVI